jgi:hypothetical protein
VTLRQDSGQVSDYNYYGHDWNKHRTSYDTMTCKPFHTGGLRCAELDESVGSPARRLSGPSMRDACANEPTASARGSGGVGVGLVARLAAGGQFRSGWRR